MLRLEATVGGLEHYRALCWRDLLRLGAEWAGALKSTMWERFVETRRKVGWSTLEHYGAEIC
jgi:hypothetical protein